MNPEERNQLLKPLEYFWNFFGGTLGDWNTEPLDLELRSGSELFNSKDFPVPIIKKETFRKYLKCLVKIGVLTPVQQSWYGNTVFIIPNN